jgi:hypothetical protein
MTRMRLALAAMTILALPGVARADVVDPCPPGFSPSHSGCHFHPQVEDLGVCGACACVLIGAGALASGLLVRRGREKGRREG